MERNKALGQLREKAVPGVEVMGIRYLVVAKAALSLDRLIAAIVGARSMVGGNDGIGAPVDDQRWFAAQRAGGADLVDADADTPVKQPFFIGQLLPCSGR